jgi:molecular chaperone GrpE
MVDRKHAHHSEEGGRPAPPSGRHSRREGPVGPPGGSDVQAVDPELAADLGAEFELRGDQLTADLEAARAEAAEWRDKGMRAQADFENTRKRLEVRHADALLRAGERIVENLLPVLDDLDRAIDHAVADGTDIVEGLDAVRRKLLDILAREGCSVVDPFSEVFDPLKHNAVQTREDLEVADHTVVEVFQKGYEMHGRVLRPAMVVVSTGGPSRE